MSADDACPVCGHGRTFAYLIREAGMAGRSPRETP